MNKTEKAMSEKIRPFSCGTQYQDWQDGNCERCRKGFAPRWDGVSPWSFDKDMTCEIEAALFLALFEDGTISEDIGKRMGWKPAGVEGVAYSWDCPEREAVEAGAVGG